jgi:AraC-like DNA-binding protein
MGGRMRITPQMTQDRDRAKQIIRQLEGKDRSRLDVAAEMGMSWDTLNRVMNDEGGRVTIAYVLAWAEKNPLVLSKLQTIK